jgi:hypothetical protein
MIWSHFRSISSTHDAMVAELFAVFPSFLPVLHERFAGNSVTRDHVPGGRLRRYAPPVLSAMKTPMPSSMVTNDHEGFALARLAN